jgi:hypothetical protein
MPARKPDAVKVMLGTMRLPPRKRRVKNTSQTAQSSSSVDQQLLTDLQARADRLRRELAESGSTYRTSTGHVRANPAAGMLSEVEARILRLTGRATRTKPTAVEGDAPITSAEREWLDAELRRQRNYFPDLTDERVLLAEYRAGRR